MNKAVFFDKDGVLNIDRGIQKDNNDIELFPNIGNIIEIIRSKNYKIIVVTNQTIVSRGLVSEIQLKKIFDEFKQLIMKQNENAIIDKIYYCPHHPNADLSEYRINCECRKPKPGMILNAAKEFKIDLNISYMIGDRISDIIAGHLAGCKTILCKTGKHNDMMIETDLEISNNIKPDYQINSIEELADIIK